MNTTSPKGVATIAAVSLGLIALMAWTFIAIGGVPAGLNSLAGNGVKCVPTPQLIPSDNGAKPTATPQMDVTAQSSVDLSKQVPSETPLPVARVVDLAKSVAESEKGKVYVFRCDGTIDLYLVGPDTARVETSVALGPGDAILRFLPAESVMGHIPPEVVASQTATPEAGSKATPTTGATPRSTQVSPTDVPYPGAP